jgi:uncharacterized membrane protein YkgB
MNNQDFCISLDNILEQKTNPNQSNSHANETHPVTNKLGQVEVLIALLLTPF